MQHHHGILERPGVRLDDERPEEPAEHLTVRQLVGAIPVGAHLARDEAVGEAFARPDRILRDARHSVHCVGHVEAMPVQCCAALHVLVVQRYLDESALPDPQLGPRRGGVERVPLDGGTVPQLNLRGPRRQAETRVSAGAVPSSVNAVTATVSVLW